MSQLNYMPNNISELLGISSGYIKRERYTRRRSLKMKIIVFLVIGIAILFCYRVIQIKVTTSQPKQTIVGKGVFIQTYERCPLRIRIFFKLPECSFISKTGTGYLVEIPKTKFGLKLITARPKMTIAGENFFVQSLERCPPKIKFLSL